jgi:hypothetical protein
MWVLTVVCVVILLTATASGYTISAYGVHQEKCKPPATRLYIYTFPVQSECVILKHSGNVGALNKSNTDYNAGVTAGKARSLDFNSTDDLKCPSTNKDFCDGWATTVKSNFNIQEFQAGEAAGKKNSQGVNFTSWSCPAAGHDVVLLRLESNKLLV